MIPQFYKVKRGADGEIDSRSVLFARMRDYRLQRFEKRGLGRTDSAHPRTARQPVYRPRGDSKELLSGSRENFERRNLTSLLYPGMKVLL